MIYYLVTSVELYILCVAVSRPEASLKLKDLVPVLYQEGSYHGEAVTLGVGGFGKVELV